MNEPKRHFTLRLRSAILLGIAVMASGQATSVATAEKTFPKDGAGYESNSVTWVKVLLM